jgi:Protein of unknown function (DUF732)
MTTTAIRRTATAAIAAVLLALGAIVSVPAANANSAADEAFIEYLDKKGVPYKNATQAIRTARQFCLDTTRQGNPSWLAGYNLALDNGWTETEAGLFINGAVPTYCPKVWE